jgi:hypothetical protein
MDREIIKMSRTIIMDREIIKMSRMIIEMDKEIVEKNRQYKQFSYEELLKSKMCISMLQT